MKNKANRTVVALAAITALSLPLHAATTVFQDDFSDNNRDGWFLLGSITTNGGAGGALTMARATSGSLTALTYFPSTTIAIGQQLVFSFSYSHSATTTDNGGLRFGIFDSQGSKVTTDLSSSSNALLADYRGYASFSTIGTGTNVQNVAERTGTNNSLWTSVSGTPYTNFTGANGQSNTAINTAYNITLTLDYISATELTATSVLPGGNTITRTLTDATPATIYDTIGIFSDGNHGTVTLDNVSVTLIPEPTTALLSALATLSLLRRRR